MITTASPVTIESGRNCSLMAKVPGRTQDHETRNPPQGFLEHRQSSIRTSIVYEDVFMATSGHLIQERSNPAPQLRKHGILVVQRNGRGEPQSHVHVMVDPFKEQKQFKLKFYF
jgi:hypothetical protein